MSGGLLAVGFDTAGAATSPTTTAPALVVTPQPCSPVGSLGACSLDPTSLQLTFQIASAPTSVLVAWNGQGRPSKAPGPAQATASLDISGAQVANKCTTSGNSSTCSFAWPAALETSGSNPSILNGTYTVTGCSSAAGSTCGTSNQLPGMSSSVLIAAAPNAPQGLQATSPSGSKAVNLQWQLGAEPDLIGYQVVMGSSVVYVCVLPAAGSSAAAPCTNPPTATNTPSTASATYGVQALRYGPDPSGTNEVDSSASTVTLTVGATTGPVQGQTGAAGGAGTGAPGGSGSTAAGGGTGAGSTAGGSGAGGTTSPTAGAATPGALPTPGPATIALGPVPVLQNGQSYTAPSPSSPSSGDDTSTTVDPGFSQTLPYGTSQANRNAVTVRSAGTTSKSNLDRLALVALGLLVLAIAGHLWYLRGGGPRVRRRLAGVPDGGAPDFPQWLTEVNPRVE